jgi:hypothetical protein
VTVVMQIRGRATYFAYRSFDPENPDIVPQSSLSGTAAAASTVAGGGVPAADREALAAAVGRAVAAGTGDDVEAVPVVSSQPAQPTGHRGPSSSATTMTVGQLEWLVVRVPLGGDAAAVEQVCP